MVMGWQATAEFGQLTMQEDNHTNKRLHQALRPYPLKEGHTKAEGKDGSADVMCGCVGEAEDAQSFKVTHLRSLPSGPLSLAKAQHAAHSPVWPQSPPPRNASPDCFTLQKYRFGLRSWPICEFLKEAFLDAFHSPWSFTLLHCAPPRPERDDQTDSRF